MSDTTFSYDGAVIQYETITTAGTYQITADGAQGGGTTASAGAGGLGAMVSGDIYLSAGAELEIIVGGEGVSAPGSNGGGGGGGGSFVIEVSIGNTAVDVNEVIAGGGGGAAATMKGSNAGLIAGAGGSGSGAGGAAGVAGGGGGGGYDGGGGGGFTGGAGSLSSAAGASGSAAGTSFAGGAGGDYNATFCGGAGGFGGGGGGGADLGGGGGGGYGGGGGGGAGGAGGAGGGGGSLDSGTNQSVTTGGATAGGNGQVTIDLLCFMQGTLIATPAGERAVETLAIGDSVLTAEGATAPVRWMGRRTLHAFGPDGYLRADPLRVMPIRIKAGALAAGLPKRDLLVSPDHALLIDDILIQAGALVNGLSITREHRLPERFTFYHVELADHALILTEGVAAETFVDNVDRLGFDNWAEHEALYGAEPSIAEMPYPRAQSHRQVPQGIRARLLARARFSEEMPQSRAA